MNPKEQTTAGAALLDLVLGGDAGGQARPGVELLRLTALDQPHQPRVEVELEGERREVSAHTIVPLGPEMVGRDVVVAFAGGRLDQPIVIGVPLTAMDEMLAPPEKRRFEASVDDERVVLEGEKEMVLRCGKASITLTRDGKVRIRGANIVSRSSGGHRIQGGTVHIN